MPWKPLAKACSICRCVTGEQEPLRMRICSTGEAAGSLVLTGVRLLARQAQMRASVRPELPAAKSGDFCA